MLRSRAATEDRLRKRAAAGDSHFCRCRRYRFGHNRRRMPSAATTSPAGQLAGFVARFDPAVAKVLRQSRAELRKRWRRTPRCRLAFLLRRLCPTRRGCCSAAAGPNRFIRLESAAALKRPEVKALIEAATAQARTPLPKSGRGEHHPVDCFQTAAPAAREIVNSPARAAG